MKPPLPPIYNPSVKIQQNPLPRKLNVGRRINTNEREVDSDPCVYRQRQQRYCRTVTATDRMDESTSLLSRGITCRACASGEFDAIFQAGWCQSDVTGCRHRFIDFSSTTTNKFN